MKKVPFRHAMLVALLCAVGVHASLLSCQRVPSSPVHHVKVLPGGINAASPIEE